MASDFSQPCERQDMESAEKPQQDRSIKLAHGPVATEAWAGEIRVNLIRVLAIISLYLYHIWHRLHGDRLVMWSFIA